MHAFCRVQTPGVDVQEMAVLATESGLHTLIHSFCPEVTAKTNLILPRLKRLNIDPMWIKVERTPIQKINDHEA